LYLHKIEIKNHSMTIKGNTSHREMRFSSIYKVMKALQNGAKSKNDILASTGLSWGSCSTIINLLNETRILTHTLNKETEGRGRKTRNYFFTKKEFLLYGMEPRADEILCSIATLGKDEIFRKTYPLEDPLSVDNIHESLTATYVSSLIDAKIKSQSILGMSVALAGGVDTKNTILANSPRIHGIDHFDFNSVFKLLPNIKYYYIEHDIHAQASSVLHSKKWYDKNYVFVHLGKGVSLSIFNNGLFLGHRGFAGEIGFIPYEYQGSSPQNRIVESAISEQGIIDFVNMNFRQNIKSMPEIKQDILESEKYIQHLYNVLKFILIVITNILDPKTIIIGGPSIGSIQHILEEKIEKNLRKETWVGGPKNIKWYDSKDMFGAYGTILNASKNITNNYIRDSLL
jgi:predicted NBD/HSP70 family sugar kinase